MGRMTGKVAFITGAARGQGRAHAVRLAQEGADIIGLDIASALDTPTYPGATEADLAETARLVEALDRRIVARTADVRDIAQVRAVVDEGVATLGGLDAVVANAGVFSSSRAEDLTDEQWDEMLDINLKGVWHTAKASIPHLKARGGGSVVLTSSTAGVKGIPNASHYTASKHGVVGLAKSLALELAPHNIRVNTVHPTNVATVMSQNPALFAMFAPDLEPEDLTVETLAPRFAALNALPVAWVDPSEIANAVLFLVSDEARYVTGTHLKVDAGATTK